ncbi:MAG: rRNA maturation RNase YbeY [Chlamydiia bacterium]|nr:rRNA maturation RNase YbeY [Chlamydiia bacterium]
MNILISNEQSALSVDEDTLETALTAILKFLEVTTDEVSLCLVDRETVCALHEEHFDDPSFTDCMTFPIDGKNPSEGYHVLGEMVICPEAAQIHAAETGNDPYDELLLYLAHCACHLIGYDDLTDSERAEMRHQEARILQYLKQESIDLHPK